MKIALFLVTTLISLKVYSISLDETLATLSKRQTELGKTNLQKNIQAKGQKKTYYTLEFDFKKAKYKLEIVSPIATDEFINNKKNISTMILKSYQDQPTPYMGILTNISECPKKYMPESFKKKINNKEIHIVKALVAGDYNHGICEDKLIKYSACTSFYLDEKKLQYYKIKIYTAPTEDCIKITNNFFENLVDL